MKPTRLISVSLAGAVSLLLLGTGVAQSKTFEVTRADDPIPGACTQRDCSLREAVIAANERSGADEVLLVDRSYSLTIEGDQDPAADGDLDLTDEIKLKHPGPGQARVDAQGVDRVFDLLAPAQLSGLLITGGIVSDAGGGIRVLGGEAVVRDTLIAGNRGRIGGGIALGDDGAELTLDRSSVRSNRAVDPGGSFFAGGGGIAVSRGSLQIRRSEVARNRALGAAGGGPGGGIYLESEGALELRASTISGNKADSRGGGLFLSGSDEIEIKGTTISQNEAASDGGGIYSSSDASLENSTLAANESEGSGGGIFATATTQTGALAINAVTVARNSAKTNGGGLVSSAGAVVSSNTIFALNRVGGALHDCGSGAISVSGGDNMSTTPCGFTGSDFVTNTPMLGNLRDNGGPTPTIALKEGSLAIDEAGPGAPDTDQRGFARDQSPDIGAFER